MTNLTRRAWIATATAATATAAAADPARPLPYLRERRLIATVDISNVSG